MFRVDLSIAILCACLIVIIQPQPFNPNQFQFNFNNYSYGYNPSIIQCYYPGCKRIPNIRNALAFNRALPSRLVQSPNNQLPNTAKNQCPVGSCQYYYECNTRNRDGFNKFCTLDNGFTGICCNQNNAHVALHVSELRSNPMPASVNVNPNEIRQFIHDLRQLEDELHQNQISSKQNTKEYSHQNFFGTNQVVLKETQSASKVLQAFIDFSRREGLSPSEIIKSRFDIRETSLAEVCQTNPTCQTSTYRLPGGICNNLINPSQGKGVSSYARLLPAEYADGINEPRAAKDGSQLPNPRLVSLSIAVEADIENNFYSLLTMQFGQFVDHDLTRTAITRTHNGKTISCCDDKVISNPRLVHPSCYPIPVPEQDHFFKSANQVCINFVRSAPSISSKCMFGPREQLNQLSAYLDGNNIYGTTDEEARNLRTLRNGRLQVSIINNEEFLPLNTRNDSKINCQIPKHSNMKCFLGGDTRLNEVPDLAVLHAVWLREHNRIADSISELNPTWSDELIYQETKRIVVAEFQHIIYNEFLPLILGPKTISHFGLKLSNGYSDSYNPTSDPSILNEFSTAAYRLHSLVQGTLHLNSPDNNVLGTVALRGMFSNPQILYEAGAYELRIAGLVGQAIQSFDNFFSKDITNHLFQIPGKKFGLDLVALNIQRGRDHGIQGYVKYREICGLSRVNSFEDLKRVFLNPEVADIMRQLYRHIEDIDLFVAGSSEKPLSGAIVGPTFACIIGEQFRRIKEGDRFWYENGNLPTSFTTNQLSQIKRITMARVFCDNSRIGIMQQNAFLMPSARNPKISCDRNEIPQLDMRTWFS